MPLEQNAFYYTTCSFYWVSCCTFCYLFLQVLFYFTCYHSVFSLNASQCTSTLHNLPILCYLCPILNIFCFYCTQYKHFLLVSVFELKLWMSSFLISVCQLPIENVFWNVVLYIPKPTCLQDHLIGYIGITGFVTVYFMRDV